MIAAIARVASPHRRQIRSSPSHRASNPTSAIVAGSSISSTRISLSSVSKASPSTMVRADRRILSSDAAPAFAFIESNSLATCTTIWRPCRMTNFSRSSRARCSVTRGRDAPTRLAISLWLKARAAECRAIPRFQSRRTVPAARSLFARAGRDSRNSNCAAAGDTTASNHCDGTA